MQATFERAFFMRTFFDNHAIEQRQTDGDIGTPGRAPAIPRRQRVEALRDHTARRPGEGHGAGEHDQVY